MKKFLLFAFALLLAVGVQARIVSLYSYKSGSTLTLQDGDTLTGSTYYEGQHNDIKVQIANHAEVTLLNVQINPQCLNFFHNHAGISALGEALICLRGTNVVYGFTGSEPGIYAKKGAWLYIFGDGSLEVGCGHFGCNDNFGVGYAAGIGAGALVYENSNTCELKYRDDVNPSCGNIQIMGGRIIAKGGKRAAGIGGGFETSCGDIRILGGNITATSESGGAGIGAGYHADDTETTMSAHCGNIIIKGGTIDATGGAVGAGIGGGMNSHVGDIIILDGVTQVTARRGTNAPYSIGRGATIGDRAQATVGEIMIGSNTYTDGISDDVFVYPAPEEVTECIAPANVRASEIDDESATIRWDAKNNEAEWIFTYRKSGASGWQFRYPVGTPSYQMTGLEPNTEYEVEIKAQCGDEHYSDYSATFRFTTASAPCLRPHTLKTYAITESAATVSWFHGFDVSQFRVRLRKYGSSDYNEYTTTSDKLRLQNLNPNTSYLVSVRAECDDSNSEYSSEHSFATLPHYPDPETCLPPYGLTASEYDHQSATLVWTPRGSEEKWLVNYKKESEDSWHQVLSSAPGGALTGLDYATIYQVRVCAVCDDSHSSDWSDTYEFATKSLPCEEAQDLVAVSIAHNFATISWHYNEDYMQDALWRLEYAKASEGAGTQRSVQDHGYTTYTLEGLEPNTEYMIRVMTECCCGSFGTSYTEWYHFTTEEEPCLEPTNLEAAVTHNSATISWSGEEDIEWFVSWFGEDGTDDADWLNGVTTYTIHHLQPNTAYNVSVQAICDYYRQSDWVSIGFVTEPNPEEGIETIESSDSPRKMVMDDAIFILRGGKIYTVTGQEVK